MWYSLSAREKAGVACLGAMLLGAGGWVGINKISHRTSNYSPSISAQAMQSAEFPVHVAGAVREPAVIAASANMLVDDAIKEAGGATKDADLGKLNLAARLIPNTRIYVPKLGEEISAEEPGPYAPGAMPASSVSGGGSSEAAGGLININTANETELDKLPGVGPVTAKRIIEYRNQIGAFKSTDQLLDVKGIGPKKLEKIRPHVTI